MEGRSAICRSATPILTFTGPAILSRVEVVSVRRGRDPNIVICAIRPEDDKELLRPDARRLNSSPGNMAQRVRMLAEVACIVKKLKR